MIKIELNNKIYFFPEKWEELILGKYQDAMSIASDMDEIGKTIELLSIISNIPKEELGDLPYTKYKVLNNIIANLLNLRQTEPKFIIEIDGIKYGMMHKISELTTAEFLDLDALVNDVENTIGNLHMIMAILYRPIISRKNNEKKLKYEIDKYNTKTLEERAELFKEKLTCDIVFSALLFSHALDQSCIDHMKVYSEQVLLEEKEELKKLKMESNNKNPSKQGGDGF